MKNHSPTQAAAARPGRTPSSSAPASEADLMAWVAAWTRQHPIRAGRYFTSLHDGSMSREVFIATQQQFAFAVSFFSRAMGALLARIPDSARRQGLIHNLAEEHGFSEGEETSGQLDGFDPARAHDLTIRVFLRTLGVTDETAARVREGPAVRAFNLGLLGACMMERVELALAALGVIEHVFAEVSAVIGQQVIARGWLAPGELAHYQLHAEIDQRHAADFFHAVAPAWRAEGRSRAAVEDGIVYGLHLFNQLYESLAVLPRDRP